MGAFLSQAIREYIVLALDVLRRRWFIFILPIFLALPIAAAAIHFVPKKYVAKSLVLLQSSNRAARASGLERQNLIEQVAAIEAWLKSDHVLRDLLPQIFEIKNPGDLKQLSTFMRAARASISMSVIGGSALEVGFEGKNPDGLGRKLEIILARIMEGLTGPEHSIFNASQFVLIQRNDSVAAAEQLLNQAIARAGLERPDQVRNLLQKLYKAESLRPSQYSDSDKFNPQTARQSREPPLPPENIDEMERAISADPAIVKSLRRLFQSYQQELVEYEALKQRLSSWVSNYVGIFESAESMLVVGRPQDPILGESPGRKLAIAIMFLSLIGGAGLVWLVELFYDGMRTREEFEKLSGLPVVARLPRLHR
jgi:capsular polysaccharide biosynthesis protein